MFVSLLEVTLGAVTIGLAFGWIVLDVRFLYARHAQLDDEHDRDTRATLDRLERIEDWIKHLDERTRKQAGAIEPARFVVHDNGPETEPIEMPTQPDMIAIQVQSALIEKPTVPRGDSDDAKARKAAWVEAELAKVRARIDAAQGA